MKYYYNEITGSVIASEQDQHYLWLHGYKEITKEEYDKRREEQAELVELAALYDNDYYEKEDLEYE